MPNGTIFKDMWRAGWVRRKIVGLTRFQQPAIRIEPDAGRSGLQLIGQATSSYNPAMAEPAPATAQIKSLRRWFQIRIRTLLLMVVGLSVWLAIVNSQANRQRRAVARIKAAGGLVGYDYEVDANFNRRTDNPAPPGPDWLRNVIGVDYFSTVIFVSFPTATDQSLAAVTDLPNLRGLELTDDIKLTDAELACVNNLPKLEALYIDGCSNVSDKSIKHLQGSKHLTMLIALQTSISLDGMRELTQSNPNLATDYPVAETAASIDANSQPTINK